MLNPRKRRGFWRGKGSCNCHKSQLATIDYEQKQKKMVVGLLESKIWHSLLDKKDCYLPAN